MSKIQVATQLWSPKRIGLNPSEAYYVYVQARDDSTINCEFSDIRHFVVDGIRYSLVMTFDDEEHLLMFNMKYPELFEISVSLSKVHNV